MTTVDLKAMDAAARLKALDIETSYIIQAPAGSGKTELLTQRYLKQLASVCQPEEVVAITFTRMAAAEMRNRIMEALQSAQSPVQPSQPHKQLTWNLARLVIKRAGDRGWNLMSNPNRLRIMTVDSLFSMIVGQLPYFSGLGSTPDVTDKAEGLYMKAAEMTMNAFFGGGSKDCDMAKVLGHLDNNVARVQELIVSMLSKRDQWSHFALGGCDRETLENGLSNLEVAKLHSAKQKLQPYYSAELVATLNFARDASLAQGGAGSLAECDPFRELSSLDISQVKAIANSVLTATGAVRKSLTRAQGFPPLESFRGKDSRAEAKAAKETMLAFMALIKNDAEFMAEFTALPHLPPSRYSDEQWVILGALFSVLRDATTNLRMVFAEEEKVDFIEVSNRANNTLDLALRDKDIALSLDYEVVHLLVDESQDISLSQYSFIEKLVSQWVAGDGRSLTLFGDPAQSIYRFRDANVSLYLKAIKQGIANIDFECLQLSLNFRSCPEVVEWVNRTFPDVFPRQADIFLGGVPYAASVAANGSLPGAGVTVHPSLIDDRGSEANQVLKLVEQELAYSDNESVAILVRSRSHLQEITESLKQSGLAFNAVDIDPLGDRQTIKDLLSLTKALLDPCDSIAWYSILRAPWCGLTLEDLIALRRSPKKYGSLLAMMKIKDVRAKLTADGADRLKKLLVSMRKTLENRCRFGLREWVTMCWHELGGPALLSTEDAFSDTQVYFDLLEQYDAGGYVADMDEFEEAIGRLYAKPVENPDTRLHIMTMHKAKGLEFDAVIIPSLGKKPRSREQQLMMWDTLNGKASAPSMLIAPIRGTGAEADKIYHYLAKIDDQKSYYEDARLFYVAATRARRALHLLGHTGFKNESLLPPAKGSLLERVWASVRPDFELAVDVLEGSEVAVVEKAELQDPGLLRVSPLWKMPRPDIGFIRKGETDTRFSRTIS